MNFDRIAPFYDPLASLVFLGNIRKSQIECLKSATPKGKVLIIGGGTGWIIPYIFESGQVEKLYYVEVSQRMLALSKDKCPRELTDRVDFIFGDENVVPHLKFDAVITNFVLDCFEELRLKKVMSLIHDSLKIQGKWYVTDFRFDKSLYRKTWQLPLFWCMLSFFRRSVGLESNKLFDVEEYFELFHMKSLITRDFAGKFIRANIFEK